MGCLKQHLNKLSNLELLLPSITHEINNALSSVKLELELLQLPLLNRKLDRIAELTDALLSYVQQNEAPRHFHLQECLDEALLLVSPYIKHKISTENYSPGEIPALYGPFHLYKQAIINIYLHAAKQIKNVDKPQIRTSLHKTASLVEVTFKVQGVLLDQNDSAMELSKLLIESQEGQFLVEILNETSLDSRVIIKMPMKSESTMETA